MIKSITKFIKELTLTADEKLLRKYDLKDECGEWTDEAEDALTRKFLDENTDYLIGIAKAYDKMAKEEETNEK